MRIISQESRRGFMLAEFVVAMTLLAMLVAATAQMSASYQKARARYAWRQAAAWAADAQWQRCFNGAPLDSLPPDGLISPEIELRTEVKPGGGRWAGCDLLTVTARIELRHQRPIIENVSGFISRRAKP